MRRQVAIVFALLAGCTADVNDVRLVLPPNGAVGFACTDAASGEPLLTGARVLGPNVVISVVVDYLAFDGVPSCRPTQLLGWCTERGCPAVRRDCRTVRVPVSDLPPSLPQIQESLLEELRADGPITELAPDGVVLVRMVLTNQTCEDVGVGSEPPPLRCEDLLGCAYSCPVQLDDVDGPILLELDALDGVCDRSTVAACALIGHPGAPACP